MDLASQHRSALIIEKGLIINGGVTRFYLNNGWFIDRAERACHRHTCHRYEVYQPGANPRGGAGLRFSADTIVEAVAMVNGAAL